MAATAQRYSRRLSDLKPGDRAVIHSLNGRGRTLQQLYEMGLLEGSEIEVVRQAPFGGPIEICVFDYHLSLRRNEAELVEVQ